MDDLAARSQLLGEAILLERASLALRRRGYVPIPEMLETIAAEWRGRAENE